MTFIRNLAIIVALGKTCESTADLVVQQQQLREALARHDELERRVEEETRRVEEKTRLVEETRRVENEALRAEYNRYRICQKPITSAWQKVLNVPDVVFASGVVRVLPSVRFAADNALIDVTDVNALKQRMVPSMLGKNDEDVFDPLSRLSFETADIAVDEWPELPLMLESIASQLHLTVPLTAHVGKLLLYERGGFFRRHRDSEHRPGHFLSVVVDLGSDCSGGRVVFDPPDRPANFGGWNDFFERDIINESERDLVWPQWQSQTRAWACWFASTYHRVEPLTDGHRVVLTFDVTVELPASSSCSLSLYPASRFEGVAPFHELVWQRIAALLCVADRAHLSQTCRDLHAMIGGTPKLLCGHLMQMNARLVDALREEHFVSMAFACRHFYLFSDDAQTVSPLLLKGRDRAIAEALRLCGWRVSVQRAVLQEELMAWDSFCESRPTMIARVRIGCAVLTDAEAAALIECNESYDAVRARIAQIDPMVMRVHRRFGSINRTAMDTDGSVDDSGPLVMPFSGVFFCETLASLRTMARSDLTGESEEMYGNHAFSKLMRYDTCIVRADKIYDDDVPDELYCAHDVKFASVNPTRNAVILRSVFL
jgi:hypothetical protein